MSPSRMSASADFHDLRRDHRPVVHVLGDVDHDAAVDQIVERQMGHVALAIVGGVHGAVEMGADMQRGVDALRHDHLGLQVLRVVHLVAGIADPAGRMHVHDVGEIDDFHRQFPQLEVSRSYQAAQRQTRAEHQEADEEPQPEGLRRDLAAHHLPEPHADERSAKRQQRRPGERDMQLAGIDRAPRRARRWRR